jgi:hypothetical protein
MEDNNCEEFDFEIMEPYHKLPVDDQTFGIVLLYIIII